MAQNWTPSFHSGGLDSLTDIMDNSSISTGRRRAESTTTTVRRQVEQDYGGTKMYGSTGMV